MTMGNVHLDDAKLKRKAYAANFVTNMHDLALLIRSDTATRDQFHVDPLTVMENAGLPTDGFRNPDGSAAVAVMVVDSEICTITLCYDDPTNPQKDDVYWAIVPATPWAPPEIANDPVAVEAYIKARNWEDAWDRATTTAFGM